MSGKAFRIGDDDLVSGFSEDFAQSMDLGRGTASAGWGIGFMGDEYGASSDLMAVDAGVGLGFTHQVFHDLADVLDVETGAMESAVSGDRAQDLADGLQTAFPRQFRALDNYSRRSHANDHAVTATIKWDGSLFNGVVRCGGAAGQESGAHPIDQAVGSDVVSGHNNYAVAAAGSNPIFR
jgi:hypothetical protein